MARALPATQKPLRPVSLLKVGGSGRNVPNELCEDIHCDFYTCHGFDNTDGDHEDDRKQHTVRYHTQSGVSGIGCWSVSGV